MGTFDLAYLAEVISEGEKKEAQFGDAEIDLPLYRSAKKATRLGDPGIIDEFERDNARWLINSAMSQCFVCSRETFWGGDKIVYPMNSSDAPAPNEDLSANVRRDYEEAASLVSQSPRSACALLRLAIQKLCIEVLQPGPKDQDIDKMIAALVKQGLPTRVQQALDVVRVVGNEAVHPGTLDLRDDEDTASRLFGTVNVIAENLITQLKHIEALYGNLPPNKLKGIEDRNIRALARPKL